MTVQRITSDGEVRITSDGEDRIVDGDDPFQYIADWTDSMAAKRLDDKDPGETVPLSFDFTTDLGAGTISGTPVVIAFVDNALRRNADPSASAMVNGAVQVTGKTVIQSIQGGIAGVDYKVRCAITTNTTPVQVLFKTSILPVRVQ